MTESYPVFLVFICHCFASYSSISVTIKKDTNTDSIFYVASVFIGTPSAQYKLALDFSDNIIRLRRDISSISSSYSPSGYGSDLIQISGIWYRFPITTPLTNYDVTTNCPTCDGTFGFRKDSTIWSIWPSISFSMGSIVLGKFNDAFLESGGCPHFDINCNNNDTTSLCSTIVFTNSGYYTAIFNAGSSTSLPPDLYYEFIGDHNIYSTEDWPFILLRFVNFDQDYDGNGNMILEDPIEYLIDDPVGGSFFGGCPTYPYIQIDSDAFLHQSINGHKKSSLQLNSDPFTIILGVNAWNDVVLHMNSISNNLSIKSYPRGNHVSSINLLLFCVMLWFYIRWKMTTTYMLSIEKKQSGRQNTITIIYILISIPIFFYEELSFTNRTILVNYPIVNIGTFSTMCFGVFVICFCWSILLTSKVPGISKTFRLNLVKNIIYEHLLLTTMWLCLIERRSDGLSNLGTLLVNITAIYNLIYYCMVTTTYYIFVGHSIFTKHMPFNFIIFILLMSLLFFQTYITYNYFASPFINYMTAHIGPDLDLPIFIVLFCVITGASTYMALLYEKRAIFNTVKFEKQIKRS